MVINKWNMEIWKLTIVFIIGVISICQTWSKLRLEESPKQLPVPVTTALTIIYKV